MKSLIFLTLLLISNAGLAQGLSCYGNVEVHQADPYILTVEWKEVYAENLFLEEISLDGFLTLASSSNVGALRIYSFAVDVSRIPESSSQDSTEAVDRAVQSVVNRLAKKYQQPIHLSCNDVIGGWPRAGGMN